MDGDESLEQTQIYRVTPLRHSTSNSTSKQKYSSRYTICNTCILQEPRAIMYYTVSLLESPDKYVCFRWAIQWRKIMHNDSRLLINIRINQHQCQWAINHIPNYAGQIEVNVPCPSKKHVKIGIGISNSEYNRSVSRFNSKSVSTIYECIERSLPFMPTE